MTRPAARMDNLRHATRWPLLVLGLVLQGQAMAVSKTLYLFSEVEGVVMLDGQPVEGAEVEQNYHWHWKNEHRTKSVKSNSQGQFRFPAVTAKSLTAAVIPHEPVIGQRITLRYQGKVHKGWVFTRHNYDSLGEVQNRRLQLVCDLNAEPTTHSETQTFGICMLRD